MAVQPYHRFPAAPVEPEALLFAVDACETRAQFADRGYSACKGCGASFDTPPGIAARSMPRPQARALSHWHLALALAQARFQGVFAISKERPHAPSSKVDYHKEKSHQDGIHERGRWPVARRAS